MHVHSSFRAVLLPLAALALLPTGGAAQQPDHRIARADALFEAAAGLEQEQALPFGRHVRETARLYLQSAQLRSISDPRRVESLHRAGSLLVSVDPRRARKVLGEAAELAMLHGNVSRTAQLFLDAAWVVDAKNLRSEEDVQAANEYLRTALLLAKSPVLSVAQREAILRRVQPSTLALAP